ARASHTTVEQWIDDADAALYRAKRAGRDRIGT
ncbi:MAG: diguanylate cyclase, partial [Xanthomonadaceae bacterium]|nr:diguanylate cyclase [Xanthomonadaceae bacterium]